MRLFQIDDSGDFSEFVWKSFEADYEEAVLEDWLEGNPEGILEDEAVLLIGRQIATNLGTFIDLLGLDRNGNVAVIELKRGRTPRTTLAQALEYASFAANLDADQLENLFRAYVGDESLELAEEHRRFYQLGSDAAITLNKDQRIVIVGQRISPEVRQTARFLAKKGVLATCVEFSFFESEDGKRLLTHDVVVGGSEGAVIRVGSKVTKEEFLSNVDDFGAPVFGALLDLCESLSLPLHWGSKGFSINVDVAGGHAAFLFGYPPHAVYKQSLHTGLTTPHGGLTKKIGAADEIGKELFEAAQETGLFIPGGKELKCSIDRQLSEEEIQRILDWVARVVSVARQEA